MSIRSNVIISTVTALFVSNAVVILLCAWLQCTPCGSRQSSFAHNAPSFEPAAIPDAAGSGPLSLPSEQPLLFPEAATVPVIVDFSRSEWISFAGSPVYPYQTGRIGVHLSTGPPLSDPPYYIFMYGELVQPHPVMETVATLTDGGAFPVFSRDDYSFERCLNRYEANYSFNTMIA